jgi:hypothetical protein
MDVAQKLGNVTEKFAKCYRKKRAMLPSFPANVTENSVPTAQNFGKIIIMGHIRFPEKKWLAGW